MDGNAKAFGPEKFGEALSGLAGPLHLELVLVDVSSGFETLSDPFARVEGVGSFGEMLLARLECAGFSPQLVVVRLKSYPCTNDSRKTNTDHDRTFQSIFERLARMEREGHPVVKVLSLGSESDFDTAVTKLPPLFFCKRRRLFFVPPCPECLSPLSDCEDESLLDEQGLPGYATSASRYLYCPVCSRKSAKFFACSARQCVEGKVLDRQGLIGLWGALEKLESPTGEETFPCRGCSDFAACYAPQSGPVLDAEQLIVPLTFHGAAIFLHEYLPLRFDEFCDLAAGRPWGECETDLQAPGQVGRQVGFTSIGDQARNTRWMFGDADRPQSALEVLNLKLSAFLDVCRAVGAVHAQQQGPVLNVLPENFWVGVGETGSFGGSLWSARVKFLGVDHGPATMQGVTELNTTGGEILPESFDFNYAYPGITDNVFAGTKTGRLKINSLEPVSGEPGKWNARASLTVLGRGLSDLGVDDRLIIRFGRAQGFQNELDLTFVFEGWEGSNILLHTDPVDLEAAELEPLQSLLSVGDLQVQFEVIHRFGVECDLYSLGMMLFRTMLVTMPQQETSVLDICRKLGEELDSELRFGASQETVGNYVRQRLETINALAERNLLFASDETMPGNIPPDLWAELLQVAFRLVLRTDGYSHLQGTNQERAQVAFQALTTDLNDILERIRDAAVQSLSMPGQSLETVLQALISDTDWLSEVLAGKPQSEPKPASPPPEQSPEPIVGTPTEVPQAVAPAARALEPEPDLDATVILRPGMVTPTPPSTPTQPLTSTPNDKAAAPVHQPATAAEEELDPEATIVLNKESAELLRTRREPDKS